MIKIAVLGYGTVGSGVAEVIWTNQEIINKRVGEELEIKYILDLREFPGTPAEHLIVHDFEQIVNDEEVKIVVEVMGGIEPAYTFVKKSLLAGKSVVTSNKALVAKHGAELLAIAKESNITIDIPVIETIPKVSKEQNLSLTKKIASYTTNVADSTGGRKTNVKLALSKINGLKVAPKEKVSFNKLTGPHTADTGYKPAIVIVNSEYVEDIGGGICQASTTLYNALIRAGIKIDEVRKHSLPVKYVPLALDAMVSEGGADLKFTNTSNYPIFINTYSDANSVTVDIYSHALPDGITYNARSETIKTLEAKPDEIVPDSKLEYTNKVLFKGEYYRLKHGKEGYEAIGYLDTYKHGELINSEKIRHEIYSPQAGVVIEGIAEPIENMTVIDNGVEVKI